MNLKISIITPCFNAEKYIEKTIKSVISQDYPNLEYIVIDGGSTDGTIDIVNQYKDKINVFVSEKDKGQYDAINKGLNLATGDVMAWLNADDVYFPWTLKTIDTLFNTFDEIKWISGKPAFMDQDDLLTTIYNGIPAKPAKFIKEGYFRDNLFGYLQQESMFWRKEVLDNCGSLHLQYPLAADFELWTRYAQKYELFSLALPLAAFRKHNSNRSSLNIDTYSSEVAVICNDKKRINPIIGFLAKQNRIMNRLIRLVIYAKGYVVYYSVSKKTWRVLKKRKSLSNVTLSTLLLEK
jgi:glycosyltransferase involved in cell wall biosynthesis